MTPTEAKVRCIEAALVLAARENQSAAARVVEIATVLYDYVQAPPMTPERVSSGSTDKPQREVLRRPKKPTDILS